MLLHLDSVGFQRAPRHLGVDEHGRDVLSFVPGDVPLPPYPTWALREETLREVARLLREFHDAMIGFRPSGVEWSTDLGDPHGDDVICHNDVCPQNVVFRDGRAVALLGFDFVAPGRRYWDVGRTIRMWGPVSAPETRIEFPRNLDCFARIAAFADAYGVPRGDADVAVAILFEAVQQGQVWVRGKVEAGDPAFVEMWHTYRLADRQRADATWLTQNRDRMVGAIQRTG